MISADKGGAVGVLLTTKYYALGLGVLQDDTQFQPVQEEDKEGHDINAMQAAHNVGIRTIAARISDKDTKSMIAGLTSPSIPSMPTMTPYPKFHKDPIAAKPVILDINALHNRSSKWASQVLSNCGPDIRCTH